jgi:hypothetical protein
MQAREKNREFTACDKCSGEIHESGRTREKQTRGGVSNVRATQGDADEAGTHLERSANIKDARESTSSMCCDSTADDCDVVSLAVTGVHRHLIEADSMSSS